MNTLVNITEIALGTVVLVAGLAGPFARGAGSGVPGRSVTIYADARVGAVNGLFGGAFAVAAVVLGVSGLVGALMVPLPVGVMVTAAGLISVLLTIPTGPPVNSVAGDRVRVSSESRLAAMLSPARPSGRRVAAGALPSRGAPHEQPARRGARPRICA
ncbi:MAG TPA: hypothetical protein VGM60_05310 [Pseudonocardia sp.]|uniref:hypothetical protein n=1 Tax=Pseudonocardia sp. TaxID=60912 RepID=UPI002F41389E